MNLLRDIDVFLLDLDGTVVGPAPTTLRRLRAMGKRLVFVTNHSSKPALEYRRKLTRMELFERGDIVYTSAMATISYLKERYGGKKVCLVATDAVREEFESGGIVLSEEAPDVCVLAHDTTLNYEKIRRLDHFLRQNKPFLATHADDVCPTSDGSMPDVGSFLAMFERCSGRTAFPVGMPFSYMGDALSRLTGTEKARMCMVGGRMQTDIRFANTCGMKSIFVLSGGTLETAKNFPDKPDLVLKSFNDIFGD